MLGIIGSTLNLYCAELFASQARRTSEVEIDQHCSYGWGTVFFFFTIKYILGSPCIFFDL